MSLRRAALFGLVLLPFVLAATAIAGVLFLRQGGFAPYRIPHGAGRIVAADAATVARGAYLAKLGDCAACHTTRGGVPFAGGRGFSTDYGTIYSSNLTADMHYGLGDWSADEFAHAMRNGVSRNGVLYPVFPYAHFAQVDDSDLDALYAYLKTVSASAQAPSPNRLDFPASWRPALIGWRMLYYHAAEAAHAPSSSSKPLERGRYLVDGLGHCAMCHSARGARGSLPPQGYLVGGRIPGVGWYAPPLDSRQLQRYSIDQLVAYLSTGTSLQGSAYGPMAEVVYNSLSALSAEDATAIATYLKNVPPHTQPTQRLLPSEQAPQPGVVNLGADVYKRACADCHGDDGRGKDAAYPPLRDAASITAPDPINAVRVVLYGGMAPTTAGNPRPYSMPPFVQQLSAAEIAAVINYVRHDWAGLPSELTAADIAGMHGIVLD